MKIEEIIAKISESINSFTTADNVEKVAELKLTLTEVKTEYDKLTNENSQLKDKLIGIVSKFPVDSKPSVKQEDDTPKSGEDLLKECIDNELKKSK